jgi:RNA polymerase sigma factor (sigma-70 family)
MTALEFNNNLSSMENNLKKYALSLTSNREEAKDLVQETYLKALTHRDKFIEFTNLKAWVYTIMKNTFINNYRKSIREISLVDNSKDLYLLNNLRESQIVLSDSEVASKEINKAIDALDDELKIPFRLHAEGYKYKEISEIQHLKIGTVKSRIFFARKKLMAKLNDYQ